MSVNLILDYGLDEDTARLAEEYVRETGEPEILGVNKVCLAAKKYSDLMKSKLTLSVCGNECVSSFLQKNGIL